jgi:outer membrane protein OmpA-like peptidoglycan-associated protein
MRRLGQIGAAFFGLTLALGAAATQASAQSATYLSNDAGYCEIFRSISKAVPAECAQEGDVWETRNARGAVLTRSIVRRDTSGTPKEAVAVQEDTPTRMSIAMKVQFAFDSAELTAEAKELLDRVAEVFKNELMTKTYVQIDGHADASGSDAYNLDLSARRARAASSLKARARASPTTPMIPFRASTGGSNSSTSAADTRASGNSRPSGGSSGGRASSPARKGRQSCAT